LRTIEAAGPACDNRPVPPSTLRLGLVAVAGLLLAGCGGGQTTYTAAKTRACLRGQQGLELRSKVDFVASTALGGAFNVKFPHNQVTLAFALDRKEAQRIVQAYERFRGKSIGLEDVLRPVHNVIALWAEHPQDSDLKTIGNCLK
jgi:hypothetical protein